jgi:serine/threonine protein kinase
MHDDPTATGPLQRGGEALAVDPSFRLDEGVILAGQYELQAPLAEGAHGAVWRALQRTLDRVVACKFLHPDVPADSSVRAEFRNEGLHAARVLHPSSVLILDAGATPGGTEWLVMEMLDGVSLAEELHKRFKLGGRARLELRHGAQVGAQIADALAAAHAAGLVHRDIKPGNVVLHRGPRGSIAKVVDYGISAAVDPRTNRVSDPPGPLLGSPRYLAPERIRGEPYDGAVDVYALGVLLFEVLAGKPLFRVPAHEPQRMLERHVRSKPPRLGDLLSRCPRALDRLVARMLDKDPTRRPSPDEVEGTLRRVADGTLRRRTVEELATDQAPLPSAAPAPDAPVPPGPDAPAIPARIAHLQSMPPTAPPTPLRQRPDLDTEVVVAGGEEEDELDFGLAGQPEADFLDASITGEAPVFDEDLDDGPTIEIED